MQGTGCHGGVTSGTAGSRGSNDVIRTFHLLAHIPHVGFILRQAPRTVWQNGHEHSTPTASLAVPD